MQRTLLQQPLRVSALGPGTRRCYASIADKYQHKLQQRAGQEGLRGGNAIDQLRQRYKARVKAQEAVAPVASPKPLVKPTANVAGDGKTAATVKTPKPRGHHKIDTYIDLEKLRLHDAKEIELLWRARFANAPDTLCAAIKGPTYRTLYQNARRHPMFVLPLFRQGQGVEMQFCQWTFPDADTAHLILTSLLEYKTRGEYARPHTVIEHHAELLPEKDIVLMKGDLTDARALTALQATWMLTLLQRFYCAKPEDMEPAAVRRRQFLQDFTTGTQFDVDALIEEAKSVPGAGDI